MEAIPFEPSTKGITWYSDVKTKWDKSKEDPVPSEVAATLLVSPVLEPTISFVAKFQWYMPGDTKFEEQKKAAEELLSKLPAKREIAGAK